MWIAETFFSIQGEGRLVGQPSAFIRTSGCNLRCWYCDTPYTSWNPEGEHLTIEEILNRIVGYPTKHVVVTGGEPFISTELEPLCAALNKQDYHITLETAATVDRHVACDLMSVSPKLRNSAPREPGQELEGRFHEERRHSPAVVARFLRDYDCQFKFVIDQPADVAEVVEYLRAFPTVQREQVYLMPQATEQADLRIKYCWLAAECLRLGYRLGQRLHVELYGHVRGT